jgi:hypothetical protein
LHQLREIQRQRLQLAATDLRQGQQGVDELRHPRRGTAHAIQIREPLAIQPMRVPLDQQLAEAIDAA